MRVNATGVLTLPKSGALGPYLRVILSGGVLALAGAEDRDLGTTKERYLASGLGSSNFAAVVSRNVEGSVKMIASGAITQFAKVYGAASGKVSAAANGNPIGIALVATTADGDELEVLRLDEPSLKSYTSVAASAAVTNTTTETAFDKSYTFAANALKAGDVIRVRAQVIATATNSTDTLTLKLLIGTTTVVATAAVDVANNDIGYIDALIVIRTAGASGTLVATGIQGLGVEATATGKPFKLASTAVDTTAAQAITVSATWSVANAGNSCRLDVLNVEILRA
jgi:hypothetical protein